MAELTRDILTHQGKFCFRFRSFLPIAMIPIAVLSIIGGNRWFEAQGGWIETIWHIVVLAIAISGFAIRFWVIGTVSDGTSGRNTHQQIAERLNTTGPYSLCRNPLYLGNFLIWGALALMTESLFFVLLYSVAFTMLYERIFMYEEQFLHQKFGKAYERWASHTPSFFPALKNYQKSESPFTIKRVLCKEYPGIINFSVLLLILETILEHSEHFRWEFEPYWFISIALVIAAALGIRLLRKKTMILNS